jgi:hypothetical protein
VNDAWSDFTSLQPMASQPPITTVNIISINIVTPRMGVRRVLIPRSMTIGSLASHSRLGEGGLIFNGEILDPQQTVESYNLHNDDAIVAIPANAPEGTIMRWIHTTRDSEDFMESVQFAVGKNSRDGFLRLRDLRAARLESRPRAFRKFLARHKTVEERPPQCFPTVLSDPPSEPSALPLPKCW